MLERFGLLPLASSAISMERLDGAGREHEPIKLLLKTGTADLEPADFDIATADLASGAGISDAINPIVSRAAMLLANGEREARACPTLIMHATHRAMSSDDLQPSTFPQPGARINSRVSLHEPFGPEDEEAWSCDFVGRVEAATGLHVVQGSVEPDGAVPEALDARWRIELIREREIWMLRSMRRD